MSISMKQPIKKQVKKSFPLLTLLTSFVVISGCATMTPSECKHTNWEAKGKADGARGALPDYLTQHAQACAKAGITPNQTLWEKGRKDGLKDYCTASNIYQVGREGYSFAPVCGFVGRTELMKLEERFEEGRRIYRLEEQIDEMHRDMYGYPWWHRWYRD